ncbi:hydantoinase/oxoprolinase family protein [Sphingomonas sp. AOB5]|uniref:hydantoinase/oxoprolinase family protein n=1 Tax=Sphingomonas sp. AOB5 TaxID=3034017 RepID=UPI0023F67A61|nr:hydantoinase/oxoprolinase family protein [Sphingomonas sp. AOB5]MDF7775555.1 hydantoinase/oxoprolinase family protein [Sphingomonas sp. AOB5]
MSWRVGVDIGGTFTDMVAVSNDGRVLRQKVPSTPGDYSQGILNAIGNAADADGLERPAITEIVHGTTIATNAILEYKGAVTGLITTKGFRDVLEIGRLRMPKLYEISWQKPPVLIERARRLETAERIAGDGSVLVALDRDEVVERGRQLIDEGAESIAVMFLNSYANPEHEIAAGAALRAAFPETPITLSVELAPEMQEYERASTTAVNAYVLPTVQRYVRLLKDSLAESGVTAPLLIMQSNGGMLSANAAAESPVLIIESGPAAGVMGCRALAESNGHDQALSFDMGGTTAKAAVIEEYQVPQATEYEVGGGVSMGSRLTRGGGYALRSPSVDLSEVGAGGGSLVWFDKAGGIQVGPKSAGAVPGPVCYGQGNTQPTVTDANLVLGYINPQGLAGGTIPVDRQASLDAIQSQVADRIGLPVLEAAFGVHSIANANMMRALRSVTIERGRDPKDFVLYAFGGNGAIHSVHIAQKMEIGTVIVPPSPGVFSAFGLLTARVERHFTQTYMQRFDTLDLAALEAAFVALEAGASVDDPEYPLTRIELERRLECRVIGQTASLPIVLPAGVVTAEAIDAAAERFRAEYEKTYGFNTDGAPLQIANLRVVAQSPKQPELNWAASLDDRRGTMQQRDVYFGPDHGLLPTPVLIRRDLAGKTLAGPAIIEEYDSTTVVPPGCDASLDANGCIVIKTNIGN